MSKTIDSVEDKTYMKLENKQFFYIGTDTFQCDIGCFINYTPKEAVKYLKNKKEIPRPFTVNRESL